MKCMMRIIPNVPNHGKFIHSLSGFFFSIMGASDEFKPQRYGRGINIVVVHREFTVRSHPDAKVG